MTNDTNMRDVREGYDTTRVIMWVAAAVVAVLLLWWIASAMQDNTPLTPNTGAEVPVLQQTTPGN